MRKLLLVPFLFLALLSLQAETIDVGGNYAQADTYYNSSVNTQAPFLPHYTYSASQTIYTSEELTALVGQQITALKYKLYNENVYMYTYHHLLKVYISEVADDQFARNDKDEVVWFNPGTLVYSENLVTDFENSCWDDYEFNFQLNSPYVYGGQNLVITVVNELTNEFEKCEASGGEFAFYCYYKPKVYHTYHYHSDASPFDSHTSPAICTYDYPIVQFVTSPAVPTSVNALEVLSIASFLNGKRLEGQWSQLQELKIYDSLGHCLYTCQGEDFTYQFQTAGVYIMVYQLHGSSEKNIYKIRV